MAAAEAVEAVSVRHAINQAELIREGLSVLLDVNNEKQSFAVVKKNHRVRVGSAFCALDPLIGASFGSVFEVRTDARGGQYLARLVNPSPPTDTGEAVQVEEEKEDATEPKIRDNRQLIDNNTAQGLSAEEIEIMKRQGAKGDEIIKALVANSTTFASKTEFSQELLLESSLRLQHFLDVQQEKYMRKKQKKYAPQLIVRRPSARRFLRVDSLALMLSMANVGAYADVLVLDSCGGLPTAAIAERLGGYGTICSTYCGERPPSIDILRLLNLDGPTAASVTRTSISTLVADRAAAMETGKILSRSTSVGLNSVAPIKKTVSPNVGTDTASGGKAEDLVQPPPNVEEGKAVTDGSSTFSAVMDVEMGGATEGEGERDESKTGQVKETEASNCSGGEALPDEGSYKGQARKKKRGNTEDGTEKERPGRPSSLELRQRWAQRGFTSLVVAALHISPSAAAQHLLPLLAPSSSFAIYHTYLQPLAECMHKLQKEKAAVGLQLSESWLREYQVLPERSHPLMQMSATGGYLLHGIAVNQMPEKKLHSTEGQQ